MLLATRLSTPSAAAPIELIGVGTISGSATDGLTLSPTTLEDGTPHNRVGGFGSAISYTGVGSLYIATPDRGPADGTTSYLDRAYLLDIPVTLGPPGSVTASVIDARLLTNELGANFTGSATAFDATNSTASLRFDPEGIRFTKKGTFFVSDEYGPFLYEFDASGQRLRALTIPSKFLITHPSNTADGELPPNNATGRQPNRGMEGLAITPDGSKLYGIMQNALIQDGALNSSNQRRGFNNRILEINTTTGETHEYLYQLDSRSNGVNEMVAINDHQFLVLERDGNAGASAAFKKIFKIDLTGASDISGVALPQAASPLPSGVIPVTKTPTPFIDLLDPSFGLAGPDFPEKIEGLAFGPDLPDGRHLLLVTSDNDFIATQDSKIFAFAIEPSALADFQPQVLRELSTLGPVHVWLGLKNSDDQGTKFDLRAELYKNNTLVAAGETRCINGVTSNPSKALEALIPFGNIVNGVLAAGEKLTLKISTRIGTASEGKTCTGHTTAVGLRLYYDAKTRPARFSAEITPSASQDYFLHTAGADFLDITAPSTSTTKQKDSSTLQATGGNLWKLIGAWSFTLP
jgi:hypothetical protein